MDVLLILVLTPVILLLAFVAYSSYPRAMDILVGDKTVLVTGGASGIGMATVEKLLSLGCQVVVCDSNGQALARLAEKHPQVKTYWVDITKTEEVQELYKELASHGIQVWGIANVAGIWNAPTQRSREMKSCVEMEVESEVAPILDVNLYGAMRVNRIFFPMLKITKGCIIQVTSTAGRVNVVGTNGAYCISKSALISYMNHLRRELNHLGIRVLCIEPGATSTGLALNSVANMGLYEYKNTQFEAMFRDSVWPMQLAGFDNPKNWRLPEQVADVIVKEMFSSVNPVPHVVVDHFVGKFGVILTSYLPYGLQDLMLNGRKWRR